MSNAILPALPYGIRVTKTPFFTTTVQAASSGRELRASRQSAVRYRYTFEAEGLLVAPTNQVQALLDHFEAHRGRWDSFLMTDPYDGVQRRVRFDQDDLEFTRVASGIWSVQPFEIITVLGS